MITKKEKFKETMVAQLECDALSDCVYLENGNRGLKIIFLKNNINASVYYLNGRIERIEIK